MTFTTLHIVLTAALTAVVVLIVGLALLPRKRWLDTIAAAVLAGAAQSLAEKPGSPSSLSWGMFADSRQRKTATPASTAAAMMSSQR